MIRTWRIGIAVGAALAAGLFLHGGVSLPAFGLAAPPPVVQAPTQAPKLGAALFEEPMPINLVRNFDPPHQHWLAGHRGVDLAANEGDQVRAAGEGVVAFVGVVVDRPIISIDHPIGIRTTYEPVTSELRRGEVVASGQVIGYLAQGNQHCARPCLHWGARIGEKTYLDPLKLLLPYTIRLYPPEPW